MKNVNFTSESGETTYSYSWEDCDINKNVRFELENSSDTWCTVTHNASNSSVKIHADAVPERQRESRSTNVLIKVNNTTCDEYFHVTQPGRPCACSAFTPVTIGATFPSAGASVGTVIGSYYNDTTCNGTISITGDLSAEAVNGEIKLTSAVGAYNDGRTFTVIFNYNGTECARGTCTQSAASCRCTTITATPHTFTAADVCGSVNPATVLTIDGCCSIVTGITGTDSDKFTVTTSTSGGNNIVKVCPNSQNTDTSTDREATVSVTATCGNDTCSSSTTVTQGHSGCTPSTCTCYEVSTPTVLSASSLTCESTSATIRWNFTAYTITQNADCTIAKTQVAQYYQDETVNFLPNTGGETSVTRSGEIEWYGHLTCLGNTCGQSNVKVPWTVELPACDSCACIPIAASWGSDISIKDIPRTGIPSEHFQVVARVYINPEYLPESCFGEYYLNSVSVVPRSGSTPEESRIDFSTGTCIPEGETEEKPCTVLTISSRGIGENQSDNAKYFIYNIDIDGSYCVSIEATQSPGIPCTCDYFIESGLIRPIRTHIVNAGTNGELVMIASGNTHGCGGLEAITNQTDMIDVFSAQTIPITARVDTQVIVTDVNYYWWASFTKNGPTGEGVLRNCSLSFKYIDRQGVTQKCTDDFIIIQSPYVCDCPETVSGYSFENTIDGKAHGKVEWGGSVYPQTIGAISNTVLSQYGPPNEGYMCQFILAESDSSWCSAYTKYYSSNYSNYTEISIVTEPNYSDSARTALIDYYVVSNPVSRNGVDETVQVFMPNWPYNKSLIDESCTYDICQQVGTLTLHQSPFGDCNCYNSEFEIIGGSSAYTGKVSYDSTTEYFSFKKTICGEATYNYHFVDENNNEISQPEWITGVTLDTTTYYDSISLILNFGQNYSDSGDTESRTAYVKVTMYLTDTMHEGQQHICDKKVTLIQEGTCTCDKMIVASDLYLPYSATTAETKLTIVNRCGIIYEEDVRFSFEGQHDWIDLDEIFVRGDYVWASFNVTPNTTSSLRSVYYTIEINGTDCRKTRNSLYQYGNPCIACSSLENNILKNRSVIFGPQEAGNERYFASTSTNGCSNVSKLSYSISYNGSQSGWLTVNSYSGDTSLYAIANAPNTDADNRYATINIVPLDSDGNPSLTNCSFNCNVTQIGTGTPYQCSCSAMTGDSSKLHITAETLDSGVYRIPLSPGEEREIGYIQLDSELPGCLEYITTNTQVATANLRIEEDTDYGSRRYFRLIVKAGDNACSTASSAIIRVDNSVSPVTQCWSQSIQFKFPTECQQNQGQ